MQILPSCGLTADYALHISWLDCFADAPCIVTQYVCKKLVFHTYNAVCTTFSLPGYRHSRAPQGRLQVAALAEQHLAVQDSESTVDQAPLSSTIASLLEATRDDQGANTPTQGQNHTRTTEIQVPRYTHGVISIAVQDRRAFPLCPHTLLPASNPLYATSSMYCARCGFVSMRTQSGLTIGQKVV